MTVPWKDADKTLYHRSGVYSRGRANAYIDLDPTDERKYNLHHLYPAMVGVCLGLQLVVYVMMYRIMRVGGLVFRPDEDDKMDAYRRIHGLGSSPDGHKKGMASRETPPSWPLSSLDRSRHNSQATDDDAFLLPGPAMSLQSAPAYMRHSSQAHTEYPPSDASSYRGVQSNKAEFGYGASPEWRGSDQPLLGSSALPLPGPRGSL
jgi:hypothetical protein